MTFLALLFAAGPSLEAAACVAEGCGPGCLEESGSAKAPSAPDASEPASGDCTDEDYCLCAIGHCHAASIPVMIEAAVTPVAIADNARIETEPLVSTAPQTLERPPRA